MENKLVKYPLSVGDQLRLNNDFTHHAPHTDQVERYGVIRDAGLVLAKTIMESSPPSAERDTAIEEVSFAVMSANAAIARYEPAPEPAGVGPGN